MAITSDKLLNRPSELHRRYGGRLAMQKSLQEKMVGGGPSNVVLTKKSIKDIISIKVNVIKIENILKGTLASEKKSLDEKKRRESGKRREKQEDKLETKKQAEKGPIKMPKIPRMGFLDWIKNFIGNVILGYFAIRLLDYLPKIKPIIKFLGSAADFVIDFGGKLLDGLVTFVDWGYKAIDFTRGMMKTIGGENFAKVFDGFTGAVSTLVETAIIAAAVIATQGGDDGGGPGPQRGGRPGRGGRVDSGSYGNSLGWERAKKGRYGDKGGHLGVEKDIRERYAKRYGRDAAIKKFGGVETLGGKPAGPKIKVPRGVKARGGLLGLVFLIPDLISSGMLVSQGRGKDGLRTLLSAVSGVVAGMGAYAATLGAAAALGITGVGLPAAISLAVAGFAASSLAGTAAYNLADAGLKKMGLFDRDPGTGKPYAYRSGGVTRGGKRQTGARRTIGKGTKGKYKRVVPRKPGEVEIKPGADIGGEDKIFGIFPNPLKAAQRALDVVNPFKVVKTAGEDLGKTDYFGPILAITSKITLGQKPSQKDYENVGLGINMLIAKGIQDKQLKGGVVAAFAEGGLVDPDVLSAAETGGDISNWVAKTFKGEIESNAQKTLRLIRENSQKKSEPTNIDQGINQKSGASDPNLDVGPGGTVTGGNADFWTLVAISRMEDSDPQGSADVAQSIYNRVASGIYGGKTIKEIVLRQGQYEPTWKYPTKGKVGIPNPEWYAIKDLASASAATGISQSDLQKTAAALRSSKYQEEARKFVGGRTDFMGGSNKPGPGDIRRKDNEPNNFFGWFVGPAAKAYGAKNPGPASAPKLGDIVVHGDGGGSETSMVEVRGGKAFPLVKGMIGTGSGQVYGAARGYGGHAGVDVVEKQPWGKDPKLPVVAYSGGKVISEKYQTSGYLSGLMVDHGSFQARYLHAKPSVRPGQNVQPGQKIANLIDLGNQTHLHFEAYKGSQRLNPTGLLRSAAAFHGESFGIVPKDGFMLKLHKGEMYKVIDKDSVDLLGFDLAKEVIDIENKAQLVSKAPSIIERLKAISGYAPYDEMTQQTIIVPTPSQSEDEYTSEESGGTSLVPVGAGSDPFESLYQGW